MKIKKQERNKAFLGALIGAGVSLIGGLASSLIGANSQKKAQQRQEALQNEQNNYATAANLAESINSSQGVTDDYYDRITLKKCGGRTKAEGGGNFDWGSVINGASSALQSIGSAAIQSSTQNNVVNMRRVAPQFKNKTRIARDSYVDRDNLYDRVQLLPIMKCGGRRRKPGGGYIQQTPEDDPNVMRDIRRAQDIRRNKQFDRDLAKIAGIIGATGAALYPLAGYASAEALVQGAASGSPLIEYPAFAGESTIPALMTLGYPYLAKEGYKKIKQIQKANEQPNEDNTEYGSYELPELVVTPQRQYKKFKRRR